MLDWGTPPPGCITPIALHNLMTDGFYAPYAANPAYLLLVDCRSAKQFTRRRLVRSKWYGTIQEDLPPYYSIVLYDEVPRAKAPDPQATGPLPELYHKLKQLRLNPQVVMGGWQALQISCFYLMEQGGDQLLGPAKPPPWFPALIIPGLLYLGHAEMACNDQVLLALGITHVVAIADRVPHTVLPALNYLVVPIPEEDPVDMNPASGGTDLVASLPTLQAFVNEAREVGGRVLAHCDQGLTRGAALVMAFLMAERRATLEDAFYYVRAARSAVHLHPGLLRQLLAYERTLFGTCITSADDLF
ncbi:hypothetical protein HAZT_HAZT010316 [Hyalella azteca]|nr:hypothetical protein HAZT_HAZT010316 [Hyalella azteca]